MRGSDMRGSDMRGSTVSKLQNELSLTRGNDGDVGQGTILSTLLGSVVVSSQATTWPKNLTSKLTFFDRKIQSCATKAIKAPSEG